ncbi:WhiB family transcriptional regulator [Streptomyces sp. NPDC005322]|uniref:WhiB family transcriptional regulator n=1 Tax=Streptomyces sp. NPDC005322 TaxID=3157032 RepID=UPI0033BF5F87
MKLTRTARDMCASCPLWAECLRDAVVDADPYGYAAATTADDRRWIRRRLGIGDAAGDLAPVEADRAAHAQLSEVTVERNRHPDASQREMALRLGLSRSTVARRLARVRERMDSPPEDDRTGPGAPDLDAILDAFDALQEHLAAERGMSVSIGSATAKKSPRENAFRRPAELLPLKIRRVNGESRSMADEPEERISFSLDDPALAVRRAVLWPLVRTAAQALAGAELLAVMLTTVPGSGMTPEALQSIRRARGVIELLTTAAGEGGPVPGEETPAVSPLAGSVSVELAMRNPVAALRQAFLAPLLRALVDALLNIETVLDMLSAVPGSRPDDVDLNAIRAARRALEDQLPACGDPGPAASPMPGERSPVAPDTVSRQSPLSIRAAVELVVATMAEPFTGRDVMNEVAALSPAAPGPHRDSGKAVSNVLSAMVKSGRLTRLSRGTYIRAKEPAPAAAPGELPESA